MTILQYCPYPLCAWALNRRQPQITRCWISYYSMILIYWKVIAFGLPGGLYSRYEILLTVVPLEYTFYCFSKNNTWHQMHPVCLAHLAHRTSIANQDATLIWRCVLILRHLTSCARAQSWHWPLHPLRPDSAWCTALASWIPLILGCGVRASPGTRPYCQGEFGQGFPL